MQKIHRFPTFIFLALLAFTISAQTKKTSSSIDQNRLAQMQARMKSFVDKGRTAGIVTLVAHRGQVVNLNAVGHQELENKIPMKTDSIFQIASMTKPITAVAVMMCEEDGLLTVLDPVEKYLPEFKNIKAQRRRNKLTRSITIRDLLTHTSGMGGGYPTATGDFLNFYRKRDKSLADSVKLFAEMPLEVQPGTKWIYSNMGIAIAGRIVEVVTGKSFDQFLEERLFKPLAMKDTHFFLPENKNARVATIYQLTDSGLKKSEIEPTRKNAIYPAPEVGIVFNGERFEFVLADAFERRKFQR